MGTAQDPFNTSLRRLAMLNACARILDNMPDKASKYGSVTIRRILRRLGESEHVPVA